MNKKNIAKRQFNIALILMLIMIIINAITNRIFSGIASYTIIDFIIIGLAFIGGWFLARAYINAVEERDEIYFAKTRNDAVIPTKRDEDAGYDIYACFEMEDMIIHPNETVKIPSGICSAFNEKYVMLLHERGSTGTKGMGQRAGVIDSGYRGEWIVPITNHNDKPIIITKATNEETLKVLEKDYIVYPYNKAICQALLVPVPKVTVVEKTLDYILSIDSKRGSGRLGSSGK